MPIWLIVSLSAYVFVAIASWPIIALTEMYGDTAYNLEGNIIEGWRKYNPKWLFRIIKVELRQIAKPKVLIAAAIMWPLLVLLYLGYVITECLEMMFHWLDGENDE